MNKIDKTFNTFDDAQDYLNTNFNGHGSIYNTYNGQCLRQCRCPSDIKSINKHPTIGVYIKDESVIHESTQIPAVTIKVNGNPQFNEFQKKYVTYRTGMVLYTSYVGGDEAGFLITMIPSVNPEYNIYIRALYVLPKYRGLHIASKLLNSVKSRNKGKNIILRAHPFADKGVSKKDLISIYRKHGFVDYPRKNDRMYIPSSGTLTESSYNRVSSSVTELNSNRLLL